jgi:hypothetical protein
MLSEAAWRQRDRRQPRLGELVEWRLVAGAHPSGQSATKCGKKNQRFALQRHTTG